MENSLVNLEFCQKIPKVELHAHLNGSISQKTLRKLYNCHKNKDELSFKEDDIVLSGQQDHTKAFNAFRLIHSLVVDIESVKIVTGDVINEFYDDNVKYLELRSTPKCLSNSSKDAYIEAIIDTIQNCVTCYDDLTVIFLVSIDRGRSVREAEENLNLALKYHKLFPEIVVGVDFSGDPSVGDAKDFIPYLKSARKNGLKVVPHVGEVQNHNEDLLVLQCQADRIGHAVFVHPKHQGSEELFEEIRKYNTPIEICLSSNMKCGLVQSFFEHPIQEWYSLQHPIIICTDDKGLFDTCSSKEYSIAAKLLNLSEKKIWELSEETINYISASDAVKERLRKIWKGMELQVFET